MREFQTQRGALEGKKEVRDGEAKELFIHKLSAALTQVGGAKVGVTLGKLRVFPEGDASGTQWLRKYHSPSTEESKNLRSPTGST